MHYGMCRTEMFSSRWEEWVGSPCSPWKDSPVSNLHDDARLLLGVNTFLKYTRLITGGGYVLEVGLVESVV